MKRDPRVVIFTDDPGWHGRSLLRALKAQGFTGVYASLKDCTFEVITNTVRIRIPGFGGVLPRGVFVRGVPGGALEEVVLRLDFLHVLDALNVPVFNTGRAIERTVDKALTTVRLALAGVPTPHTWMCESLAHAQVCVEKNLTANKPLALKPLFGSQGEGIVLIESLAQLEQAVPVGGVYYLQEYLDRGGPPYRDWRVLVIAGRARFAMERVSDHWITNRAQGAQCVAATMTSQMADLAEVAANALDVDYAGVDLMRDGNDAWVVSEVNGVPAWWGLTQATGADVTAAIVEAFIAKIFASENG